MVWVLAWWPMYRENTSQPNSACSEQRCYRVSRGLSTPLSRHTAHATSYWHRGQAAQPPHQHCLQPVLSPRRGFFRPRLEQSDQGSVEVDCSPGVAAAPYGRPVTLLLFSCPRRTPDQLAHSEWDEANRSCFNTDEVIFFSLWVSSLFRKHLKITGFTTLRVSPGWSSRGPGNSSADQVPTQILTGENQF